jgi:uncharacterized protein YecE (DUF72 family)
MERSVQRLSVMPRSRRSGTIRVGISGWRYAGWRGEFYPPGLPQRAEMQYACSRFPAVEINGTFYSLQRKAYFQAWHDATHDDFVFAVKGSRFLTHMKQLNDPAQALANFFGQGILALGPKLGPVLWQFSQRFRFREERLRPFVELLPRDHDAAARLARKHDHRVKDPATRPHAHLPIRHAIEVRHDSFLVPAFVDLLREHDIGLVVSDNPGLYPVVEETTTDFVYIRLHGAERMYYGSYADPLLDHWAERLLAWSRGREPDRPARITDRNPPPASRRDVYAFFDNDEKTKAPFDARRLMERLGLAHDFPEPGTPQALPP